LAESPKRVERLQANAAALRDGLRSEGLEPKGSDTQIVPLVVGEAEDAVALCERLLAEGIFAQAIRPPTMPPGTCRLRLTVMATHRVADLRHAARRIGAACREMGLAPATGGRPPVGAGSVVRLREAA
jgi:glycine C-acetyltransferase